MYINEHWNAFNIIAVVQVVDCVILTRSVVWYTMIFASQKKKKKL